MKNLKTHLFKTKHPSWMLFVVAGILTAAFGILVLGDGKLATQLAQPQPSQELATQQFQPEEPVIEYVSNELLIKIKSPQHQRIKKDPEPEDTGLSSLNKLNKEQGVTKFERIAKPSKKTKNPSHEVFRWYKITLAGEREIIKEEVREVVLTPEELEGESTTSEKSQKIKSVLAKYKGDINIETVELSYIVHTTAIPNDTYADPEQDGTWSQGAWGQSYEDLWGLKKIEADKAWDITTGSEQIVVAVIDTGIDYNHSDIAQNIWTNPGEIPDNGIDDDNNGFIDDIRGWDFVDWFDRDFLPDPPDNDPMDDNGHGTHVAGTIGAAGNNNVGIAGVGWQIKLMAVKSLCWQGTGFSPELAAGIVYAVDNGARVLNNSWGGYGGSGSIKDAINYAHDVYGAVIVVAAGNNNVDIGYEDYEVSVFPASYRKVIAVAASDWSDAKAGFSNFGDKIDVTAPGVGILSLRALNMDMYGGGTHIVNSSYYWANGTSMASPHVSGLAALILTYHPDFSNEDVRQVLRISADDVGTPGFDINSGYGRINAVKALSIDSVLKVYIDSPLPGETFSMTDNPYVLEIRGTATGENFQQYKIEYKSREMNSDTWHSIIDSSTPVENGVLSTWQMPFLETGTYVLKLTATDRNGKRFYDYVVISAERWVRRVTSLLSYAPFAPPDFFYPKIVWSEYLENPEVFLYDLLTNSRTQLSDYYTGSEMPAISGDYIVWQSGFPPDIFVHDFSTNTTRRIEIPRSAQYRPDISSDKIVWADDRDGYLQIYLYDLSTETEKRITTDDEIDHWNPRISGDKIVWMSRNKDGFYHIFLYDLSTSTTQQLTPNDISDRTDPDISGNLIVWADNRNETRSKYKNIYGLGNWDIYLYDLSTGTEHQITNKPGCEINPAIFSNKIVWEDSLDGIWALKDIYMYDFLNNTESRITASPMAERYPAISDNKIIWVTVRINDPPLPGIYIYDPPPEAPCDSYGDVNNDGYVTNNDYDLVDQYVAGLILFTSDQQKRADVDGNREIDNVDALFITQYVQGIRENFSVCIDFDDDGFTGIVENYLGTNPNLACGPNAWPPDFNDNGVVQIDDVIFVVGKFGLSSGDPGYTPRAELVSQNGIIQIDDVAKISNLFGRSCLP